MAVSLAREFEARRERGGRREGEASERARTPPAMGTIDFGDFMAALSRDAAKAEPPIEPCIEQGAKHFAKRKEQAELEQGAVIPPPAEYLNPRFSV